MRTHTFSVDGFGTFVLNDDNQTVISQPAGSSLTYAQAKQLNIDNPPPVIETTPKGPVLLKSPVTIPNDALPFNLDDQKVFLEPNKKYEIRFRVTRYSSGVALALGFSVPGDLQPAVIAWNDIGLDGFFLGADDELTLSQFGNGEYIGPEIIGTITTTAESGFLTPQIRQSVAGNQPSQVSDAYMEVIESGQ